MSKMTSSLSAISLSAVAALLALAFAAMPASAANTRSFISASGLDTNSCARTAPCRTLQVAYNNTSSGGEINMLDPAGYGPVTITHAISIVNDGVGSAGILVPSGGTGITINAGPTDAINLRGLIVEGAGGGLTGILFNSGKSLTIENSVIRGLTGDGIDFVPNVSSSLAVSNTMVADNSGTGILVHPFGLAIAVEAVFNRVEAYNNINFGIEVLGTGSTGTIDAAVTDSVLSMNDFGLAVQSSTGHAVTSVMASRSVLANNGIGLLASGAQAALTVATLDLAQSTVTGNKGNSFQITAPAVIKTFGDNYFDNNGPNVGTLTSIGKQ
jgi:hypothetical protein